VFPFSFIIKFHIFNYATKYALENEISVQPEEFVFPENEYSDFIAYLDNEKFDYETEREHVLDQLIKISKKEKYYESAKEEFESIKKKLKHNRKKDLQLFQEEITNLLSIEIMSRQYYQKGRIIYSLGKDADVLKAIEVIENKDIYSTLLKDQSEDD
jgi:carboxyl-terminal processing protease